MAVEESVMALQELGLTLTEAKIYLGLLAHNPANGYRITKTTGVPSAKVYEGLERLTGRGLVASVEGTKEYVPLPLEEFLSERHARLGEVSELLRSTVKKQLQRVQGELLWHGKGYEAALKRASDLIEASHSTVLLSAWPGEFERLNAGLEASLKRNVTVSAIVFAPLETCLSLLTPLQTYANFHLFPHAALSTTYLRHGHQANLVVDDEATLMMDGSQGNEWTGVWTANPAVVRTVANYIRHDIYINKLYFEMGELLRRRYGQALEVLLDVTKGSLNIALLPERGVP